MSRHSVAATVALVTALACAAPPVMLAAQGHGRGQAKHDDKKHDVATHDTVVFDRDGHVRVIHEYMLAGSLPPGLAKREALPPGLRAQLHERGELPPGLQKRLIAVPAPLIARLPPVPPYYHRYFAGEDLIVVDTRTHRIAYLVPDVWR